MPCSCTPELLICACHTVLSDVLLQCMQGTGSSLPATPQPDQQHGTVNPQHATKYIFQQVRFWWDTGNVYLGTIYWLRIIHIGRCSGMCTLGLMRGLSAACPAFHWGLQLQTSVLRLPGCIPR